MPSIGISTYGRTHDLISAHVNQSQIYVRAVGKCLLRSVFDVTRLGRQISDFTFEVPAPSRWHVAVDARCGTRAPCGGKQAVVAHLSGPKVASNRLRFATLSGQHGELSTSPRGANCLGCPATSFTASPTSGRALDRAQSANAASGMYDEIVVRTACCRSADRRRAEETSPCAICIRWCASPTSTRASTSTASKLGMEEVRRVDNQAGRFTLIFLAAPADKAQRRRRACPAARADLQLGPRGLRRAAAISATSPSRSTTSTRPASG